MASPKISLKIIIDNNSKRVLFAEAGKDFVDFLFNLLALPVGTVTRLLTKSAMVGSLGNLYGSIEELSDTYLLSAHTKDSLLRPKVSASAAQIPLLPAVNQCPVVKPIKIYACSRNSTNYYTSSSLSNPVYCSSDHVSSLPTTVCPTCKNFMTREMKYVVAGHRNEVDLDNHDGFVKEVMTYMVMDNLVVKPMSTICSITLLNEFNIKDFGALEVKAIDLDMTQGLKLLKASVHSETVLTNVFSDFFNAKVESSHINKFNFPVVN